jgi:UDP-glucose 4-epimerase
MILITGGLGFIGSHVVREFLDVGETVVATQAPADRLAPFLVPALGRGLTVAAVDLCSPHDIIDVCRRHRVDGIVHLAGPAIDVLSPAEDYRQNSISLINTLEAGRMAEVRRISIASSVAVYFGVPGPLHEDALVRLCPKHPIEAYKKSEELLSVHYGSRTGVEIVSLRLASIYGPLYRSLRHLPARLVHAVNRGVPGPLPMNALATLYADDHATDLCYVADCARGIRLVHQATSLRHQVYNIGGGENVTNRRFVEAARSVFPSGVFALEDGTSDRNWQNATMTIDRAAADVGYRPEYSIEAALEAYYRWLHEGHEF